MAYPAVQAYIHYGDWDDETKSHPIGKWLEGYTRGFDTSVDTIGAERDKWHSPDFTLVKPDGSVQEGVEKAWPATAEMYRPLIKTHHQPRYFTVHETSEGDKWELFGIADLFYNLAGEGPPGTVKDLNGDTFDGMNPAAFKFTFVKSGNGPDGIQMSRSEILSDGTPILMQLLKRGVVKPTDLGLSS